MTTVACVGVCVGDVIFSVGTLPAGAGKLHARAREEVGGGPAANAAVTVAALGGSGRFIGAVGDDHLGSELTDELTRLGVDATRVRVVPGHRSPLSAITVDEIGDRAIVNHTDRDLFGAARAVGPEDLRDSDAVLADVRWHSGALAALEWARDNGVPGIVDFDIGAGAPEPLLSTASHIAFSADALRHLAGLGDLTEALRRVSEDTDAWIGVTDGENGAYWLDEGAVRHMEAFQVEVVDTTGAGDVFHGAFALGLASGRSETDSVRLGSAAAAITCTRFGGRAGIPTKAEVETFLEERR